MAVVKANGYGHGLVATAKALDAADGLAVARLQEALTLRESGIDQRLLLLATLLGTSDLETCARHDIDVVAHDAHSLNTILTQARATPLRVWLKLDSGMHRAGLDPSEFRRADALLRAHKGVVELIHMTHFASAGDESSRARQLECFMQCHAVNPDAPMSTANSAALIACADTRQQWVRPGIMLYGVNPLLGKSDVRLRPTMTMASYVISIRNIVAGESVGYDGRWTSTRASRIGTIGIGYGDGYPRHARNGTPILIRDRIVPLAGTVSMDSLMVDLTDHDDIAVGDEAILWGNRLPASVIAEHSGTIPYDLLACVTDRVMRVYL